MITQLNLDIHEHILSYLNLVDSISLLRTSTELYFCSSFWLSALRRTSSIRPLACPPHTDLLAVRFNELRKIGLRTSSIMQNWKSPKPVPTSIRKTTLKRHERIVSVVPGTHLALTISTHHSSAFIVNCWDLGSGKLIRSISLGHLRTSSHRHRCRRGLVNNSLPCTGIPGRFTLPIIAYNKSKGKWSIVVVCLVYSNPSSIALETLCTLSINEGGVWFHTIWAVAESDTVKVVISRVAGAIAIAEFDLINVNSEAELQEGDFKHFTFTTMAEAWLSSLIRWNGSLFLLACNILGSTRMYAFSKPYERFSEGFDTFPPFRDSMLSHNCYQIHWTKTRIPGASNTSTSLLRVDPSSGLIQLVTCGLPSHAPDGMVRNLPVSPELLGSIGYQLDFITHDLPLPFKLVLGMAEVHFDDHLGMIYIGGQNPGVVYTVSYGLPEAPPDMAHKLRQMYYRIYRRITTRNA